MSTSDHAIRVAQNISAMDEALAQVTALAAAGKDLRQIEAGLSVSLKAREYAQQLCIDSSDDRKQVVEALKLLLRAIEESSDLSELEEQFALENAISELLIHVSSRMLETRAKLPAVLEIYRRAIDVMNGWQAQGRIKFGYNSKKSYYSAYQEDELEARRMQYMFHGSDVETVADAMEQFPSKLKV